MERGVRVFWGVRGDSRLRGNDGGGCGNDGDRGTDGGECGRVEGRRVRWLEVGTFRAWGYLPEFDVFGTVSCWYVSCMGESPWVVVSWSRHSPRVVRKFCSVKYDSVGSMCLC